MCPQLADIVGETSGDRWAPLIESGCRTGRELERLWERQQGVVRECCTYLGEEFEGPFSTPVVEVGEGSVDGSTRSRLGEAERS